MTGPAELWRDVRAGARAIARAPFVSAVIVLSLAVGIGVNTAVFSWLQALVLQPLPGVRDAGRIYLVEPRSEAGTSPGASWLEYRDLQTALPSFEDVLASRMVPFNLGDAGRTERRYGMLVSGNYFSALGLMPAIGRFLQPPEVRAPGREPVVVISYDLWQARFGGAPGVIGQPLRVNDRVLTIVGVAPAGFQGTVVALQFDLWVPATLAPELLSGSRDLEDRGLRGYSLMGRLRAGATPAGAQAELDRAMSDLARTYPATNLGVGGQVLPFWQAPRGPQQMLAGALALLQAIMLLLLLTVCGNTANLALARASTRAREIGVRLALGARPARIVSLLVVENLVLALAGAALGAAFAMWGTLALRAVPLIGAVPIKFQTRVDATGLAVALVLGVLAGALTGLAPAVQLARIDPQTALRAGMRAAGRNRVRHVLMAVQVALASLILVVAGLFYRSFVEAQEINPGFIKAGVILGAYDFADRNPDGATSRQFAARLLDRLQALPGVESAAIASFVPLDIHGMSLRPFAVEGRARTDAGDDEALANVVTPGYLQTMGIPLVSGRDFAPIADQTAPRQVIVNEEFARRFLPGADPIGRQLTSRDQTYVVIGVARTSLYESFSEAPTPLMYFSYRDRPSPRGEIHLRTRSGGEAALGADLQRVVRELDPMLPVYDVRTLSDHVEKNLFLRRIPARMFVWLGPLVLGLAAVGIYAVVAHAVSQRTREIGIRLSLGGSAQRVELEIIAETLRVVVTGALLGWLVAFAVSLHLAGSGGPDAPVFVGVPAILLAVAFAACWWPARRAARINPVRALRDE